MKMQQGAATLAECRNLRTLEVDLAVKRHEHLHGLQLIIPRRKRPVFMNEFAGKVLDGVCEDIQRTTGLRSNAAAAIGAGRRGAKRLRGGWN
jgi:hypothetical protein